MNLAKRKHRYVHEAMNRIDCYDFHIHGADAAEIAEMYGVDCSDAKIKDNEPDVRIKIHLDYEWENRNDQVEIRIITDKGCRIQHFTVALEPILDIAFVHYATLVPIHLIESKIKLKASQEARALRDSVFDELKTYELSL